MKEANKLLDHDWGPVTPLARAAFAYPRSGSMYPTIFRFVPAAENVVIPAAVNSASELSVSERGSLIAGSGWFELREGLSVAAALSIFMGLASRRWAAGHSSCFQSLKPLRSDRLAALPTMS